jgi:hypothetical protein
MNKYFIFIIAFVFVVLGIIFYILHNAYPDYQLGVLMIGNAIMALLTATSYLIVKKTVHQRPQAFVRGVYGASLLKLMVCMFSILAYVLINRPNIHKPSVFILLGIYVVYTTAETLSLSKLARVGR